MAQSTVEKILESRRSASGAGTAVSVSDNDKFSLILIGDKMEENFLELKFRTGLRTAFPYSDILFMNYDPDSGSLDVDFGGFLVTVKGRGLGDRVFDGIKQKRVVWLKEADSEMQDHSANELFIGEILVTPPDTGQAAAA